MRLQRIRALSRSIVEGRLSAARRLGGNFAAIALRGGSLVLGVLSVTIIAPFLGSEDLGRYAVLQSLIAWAGLATLGLIETCSGLLGKQRSGRAARRSFEGAVGIVSVAAMAAGAIATAALVLTAAALTDIGWLNVLPFVIGICCALAGAPFSLAQAPLNARGEVGRSTAWGFAGTAAALGSVLLVIQAGVAPPFRLLVVAAVTGVTTLAIRVAMYRVECARVFGRLPAGAIAPPSWRQARALLRESYPFMIIMLAAMAAFQVDRFVAYTFLSPADTARLDVVLKIYLAVYGLYSVLLTRLWKLVGHPWNSGDRLGARRAAVRALWRGLMFWSAVAAVLIPATPPIVHAFTRGTLEVHDLAFVALVSLYMAVRGLIDTVTISIYATRCQQRTLTAVIAHGVLNIPLSVGGCMLFGLPGIVLGQLGALLLTSGWRFPQIFWHCTADEK